MRRMKILTLHRRQECCPRRLQDKPEIGTNIIKGYKKSVWRTQIFTGNETYIYKSLLPRPGSSPGVQTDRPRTGSCRKKSSGKCVHLYVTQANRIWLVSPTTLKCFTVRWTMNAGSLPCSHTLRSHSMQSASHRGQEQACVLKHFFPWHTQASQKSQMAPWWKQTHTFTIKDSCVCGHWKQFCGRVMFRYETAYNDSITEVLDKS